MTDKQAMYEDLYSQLAPEGTALDDYISGLETDFEMAKESHFCTSFCLLSAIFYTTPTFFPII